jgi:hypothetical protein
MTWSAVLRLVAGLVLPAVELLGAPAPDARGPVPARDRDLRRSGRGLTPLQPVCVYEAESGQRVHHAAHDGEVGIQWPGFGRPVEGRGTWTHR